MNKSYETPGLATLSLTSPVLFLFYGKKLPESLDRSSLRKPPRRNRTGENIGDAWTFLLRLLLPREACKSSMVFVSSPTTVLDGSFDLRPEKLVNRPRC
ncbi:hypothetical protein HA466_0270230 [Hirschfeldia incana]|nr:hypothetical protein HA466_0270230 [Hirschfeldia incana]KAJ0234909.1 hypothetical protein HA466_0270230 [Hirschfeldia incana]